MFEVYSPMKNTAEVRNDGVSVYYTARIKLDVWQKLALVFANIVVLGVYGAVCYDVAGDKIDRSTLLALFAIAPTVYITTLGKKTLWNIYGAEHIIINTKTLAVTRNYGWFTTTLKTIPYRSLYYKIEEHGNWQHAGKGVIHFIDHNKMDIPVEILRSAILVPVEVLNELVAQLDVIFAIEHLDKSGERYIHLN